MVKPGKVASCFQRDALGNRALVLYDSTSQDKKHPCLTLVIKYLRPHHTIQLYPRVSAGGGWRGRETSVRRFEAMRKSHGCSRFDRRGAETEERVLAPPPLPRTTVAETQQQRHSRSSSSPPWPTTMSSGRSRANGKLDVTPKAPAETSLS